VSESKEVSILTEFRSTIDRMGDQFLAALPAHVSVDKFKRAVVTAVSLTPKLLECDRRSLLASAMRAASDGLLTDGRESALVPFKGNVQYLPMVGGLLKRMRQSDDVKDVSVGCFYRGDDFDHWRDETCEHLKHRPQYNGGSRGDSDLLGSYAIVRTNNGGTYIRVLDRADIDKARAVSRAGRDDSPWNTWFPQMCEKTALKSVAKIAPMSTDVLDFIQRDNLETIDLQQYQHPHDGPKPTRPTRLAALVDSSAAMDAAVAEDAPPAASGEAEAAPRGGTI